MVRQTIKLIVDAKRRTKTALFIISDFLVLTISLFFMFSSHETQPSSRFFWVIMFLVPTLSILTCYRTGLYQTLARHLSAFTLRLLVFCSFASTAYLFGLSLLVSHHFSLPAYSTYLAFICFGFSAVRFIVSQIYLHLMTVPPKIVAIYGAGDAGRQLLKGLMENRDYRPVFFIDDNPQLQNIRLLGIKVFSLEAAIQKIQARRVQMVLLAMPSAKTRRLQKIFLELSPLPVQLKSVPGLAELINGQVRHEELRSPSIEDLIGRHPVPPIPELIRKNLNGKVVMVTGAGGTIGSELCREIVRNGAAKLIVFDVSEFALYNLLNSLEADRNNEYFKTEIYPVIGTVQNEFHLAQTLNDFVVDTIYHAAAYKHVPMIESNIFEGLKNNVLGTYNLARAAINAEVRDFIFISTDKAVCPTSYMGASKRLAEIICHSFNTEAIQTQFSIVRFGNVIGSSGSVIPLFAHQIQAGGPLTVTHQEVTRYFMTVKEAAQLVIQAASLSKDGNIYILDMGEPVKILDIAKQMASLLGRGTYILGEASGQDNDLPIKITGLRPGEKLHEELTQNNELLETAHPRIFTSREELVSIKTLSDEIETLKAACERMDQEAVNCVINALPVDFNHQKNTPISPSQSIR